MSLLDDAIKQHLELKRAHGAPPEEVERELDEVLGDGEGAGEPAAVAPVIEPEPAAGDAIPAAVPDDEAAGGSWLDEDDAFVDAPAPASVDPGPSGSVAPSGEIPLDATPEFFEETPEHDKLWFEEEPPRDFDFDD